jgi:diguanylate cyclase (GGDEF)-like protein/PAS domain S-box-containing protein
VIARLSALTRRSLVLAAAVAAPLLVGQVAIRSATARQRTSHAASAILARHVTVAERAVRAALVVSRPGPRTDVLLEARADLRAVRVQLDSLRTVLDDRSRDEAAALRAILGDQRATLAAADLRLLAALDVVTAPVRDTSAAADASALARLIAAEREIVALATDRERRLQADADAHLERLRGLAAALAVLQLLTLVVGGALVMRPATTATDRLTSELRQARARLQTAHLELTREREFATSLVHSAADAMFAFDGALRIIAWNPAMERWTGVLRADAMGRAPEEIQAELDWGDAGRPYARALTGEIVQVHDRPGRASAADPFRYFDASCVPLRDSDGRISGGLVAARDVTERVLAAEQVRSSEARFHALFEQAPLGIVLLDDAGTVVEANPAFERLIGREAADLRGTAIEDLSPPEDSATASEPVRELKAGQRASVAIEQRFARPGGETVWVSLTVRRMSVVGSGVTLIGMAQDVTARRELEARLSHQAYHDPLTGLANRTRLRDQLDRALVSAGQSPDRVALIYVDLDDFKKVNDSLGHAAGDRLLRVVAERLLNATRGSDTVARLGGDEFAILLENVRTEADVLVVAERVGRAMRSPIALEGQEVFVGASVGVARGSDAVGHAGGADELLRNADVAMYVAKRGGKGRHALYAREMNADALARLELEAELRHALEREELVLHYQPLVGLDDGRVLGVEALLRWAHPRRGLLTPAAFVPLAEDTGLIVPIGRWALGEACTQAAAWNARRVGSADAEPLTLSVNVAERQLRDESIVADVRDALAASGLPPAHLLLELTESVFLQHEDGVVATLEEIKALGVRIGIDDFGTGYAGLRYLQRYPVDALKIDKSFVAGLTPADGEDEATGLALARAIVALGDTLALRTMAEGVEESPQWEQLRQLGCTIGQGHLFARALPAEDVESYLGLAAAGEAVGQAA